MANSVSERAQRQGDSGPIPARRDRIFEKNSYFYYHTREGIDIGPFDTRQDAERGVADFIEYMIREPQTAATLERYAQRVA